MYELKTLDCVWLELDSMAGTLFCYPSSKLDDFDSKHAVYNKSKYTSGYYH